jgi:hypothetical protein
MSIYLTNYKYFQIIPVQHHKENLPVNICLCDRYLINEVDKFMDFFVEKTLFKFFMQSHSMLLSNTFHLMTSSMYILCMKNNFFYFNLFSFWKEIRWKVKESKNN